MDSRRDTSCLWNLDHCWLWLLPATYGRMTPEQEESACGRLVGLFVELNQRRTLGRTEVSSATPERSYRWLRPKRLKPARFAALAAGACSLGPSLRAPK